MKTKIKNQCFFAALVAGFSFISAGPVIAQVFTNLYNFADGGNGLTSSMIISSNTLYGTLENGGSSSNGAVFAINKDGTSFTNLHSFTTTINLTNSDGTSPKAALVLSGNTLYGTAYNGGIAGNGTVFAVNTDGTGFTNLHSFTAGSIYVGGTNSDGIWPQGALILSSNTLYGTAAFSGGLGGGTVFAVNTDGTGFTNLHNFTGTNDGATPEAGLIISGNTLYGTTFAGGSNGVGTVFAVNTDGTSFTNLHNFSYTNDGANPSAALTLLGNTLYGTANFGGSNRTGTVFAVNTDGTSFTNLHSFAAGKFTNNTLGSFTNSDGAYPYAGLVLSGNILYGTAYNGGSNANGTVFGINIVGTGFTNLHTFSATSTPYYTNSDGAYPYTGLVFSGTTMYGATEAGGSEGYGTVFSLSFLPQLNIIYSGTNVILTWPTNVPGFDYELNHLTLQSAANLGPSAVWSTVSPGPVIVNGQNTVTNPISGSGRFYCLIRTPVKPRD